MKQQLNLYLISQTVNTGYDTYDSAVVAAVDVKSARRIHPGSFCDWSDKMRAWVYISNGQQAAVGDWVSDLKSIKVELIGGAAEGTEPRLILASFNAG